MAVTACRANGLPGVVLSVLGRSSTLERHYFVPGHKLCNNGSKFSATSSHLFVLFEFFGAQENSLAVAWDTDECPATKQIPGETLTTFSGEQLFSPGTTVCLALRLQFPPPCTQKVAAKWLSINPSCLGLLLTDCEGDKALFCVVDVEESGLDNPFVQIQVQRSGPGQIPVDFICGWDAQLPSQAIRNDHDLSKVAAFFEEFFAVYLVYADGSLHIFSPILLPCELTLPIVVCDFLDYFKPRVESLFSTESFAKDEHEEEAAFRPWSKLATIFQGLTISRGTHRDGLTEDGCPILCRLTRRSQEPKLFISHFHGPGAVGLHPIVTQVQELPRKFTWIDSQHILVLAVDRQQETLQAKVKCLLAISPDGCLPCLQETQGPSTPSPFGTPQNASIPIIIAGDIILDLLQIPNKFCAVLTNKELCVIGYTRPLHDAMAPPIVRRVYNQPITPSTTAVLSYCSDRNTLACSEPFLEIELLPTEPLGSEGRSRGQPINGTGEESNRGDVVFPVDQDEVRQNLARVDRLTTLCVEAAASLCRKRKLEKKAATFHDLTNVIDQYRSFISEIRELENILIRENDNSGRTLDIFAKAVAKSAATQSALVRQQEVLLEKATNLERIQHDLELKLERFEPKEGLRHASWDLILGLLKTKGLVTDRDEVAFSVFPPFVQLCNAFSQFASDYLMLSKPLANTRQLSSVRDRQGLHIEEELLLVRQKLKQLEDLRIEKTCE